MVVELSYNALTQVHPQRIWDYNNFCAGPHSFNHTMVDVSAAVIWSWAYTGQVHTSPYFSVLTFHFLTRLPSYENEAGVSPTPSCITQKNFTCGLHWAVSLFRRLWLSGVQISMWCVKSITVIKGTSRYLGRNERVLDKHATYRMIKLATKWTPAQLHQSLRSQQYFIHPLSCRTEISIVLRNLFVGHQ